MRPGCRLMRPRQAGESCRPRRGGVWSGSSPRADRLLFCLSCWLHSSRSRRGGCLASQPLAEVCRHAPAARQLNTSVAKIGLDFTPSTCHLLLLAVSRREGRGHLYCWLPLPSAWKDGHRCGAIGARLPSVPGRHTSPTAFPFLPAIPSLCSALPLTLLLPPLANECPALLAPGRDELLGCEPP